MEGRVYGLRWLRGRENQGSAARKKIEVRKCGKNGMGESKELWSEKSVAEERESEFLERESEVELLIYKKNNRNENEN
jgi:hypothetical protein